MDNKRYEQDFTSQIKESYGKVLYTYVTHNKQIFILRTVQSIIDVLEIVLTAITTVGIFSTLIVDERLLLIVSGIFAAIALALNLVSRGARFTESIREHCRISDQLWTVVQTYQTLLVDIPILDQTSAIERRDKLIEETATIYKDAPRTGRLSYRLAQKAIKEEQEQSFSNDELNAILPRS